MAQETNKLTRDARFTVSLNQDVYRRYVELAHRHYMQPATLMAAVLTWWDHHQDEYGRTSAAEVIRLEDVLRSIR